MKDPYKVLGISPNATDEEVKKAYKQLVKKYHPDNYANSPLSDLAEEKMKEINEAYDAINDMRSGKSNFSGSSGSSYIPFNKIRMLINQRRYPEADTFLEGYDQNSRTAEWYYLKGLVYAGRGYIYEARQSIETASYMDPDNTEYKQALSHLGNVSSSRNQRYSSTSDGGCSTCDVCQGLICADCCCECMGGDLIRCC